MFGLFTDKSPPPPPPGGARRATRAARRATRAARRATRAARRGTVGPSSYREPTSRPDSSVTSRRRRATARASSRVSAMAVVNARLAEA